VKHGVRSSALGTFVALVVLVASLASGAGATAGHGARFRQVAHISIAGDQCLGSAVAVDGNGRIIAASSPCAGKNANTILVFREPASGWRRGVKPVAKLTASPAHPAGSLGASSNQGPDGLAISADGSTIVAGDSLGQNGGAVYVFQEPSGGWHSETDTAYLNGTGPNDTSDGQSSLGGSVAVSADGSVVLGYAPGFSGQLNYGLQSGAINVYQRPASGWTSAGEGFTTQLITPVGHAVDEPQLGPPAISPDGSVIVAPAASALLVYNESASGWAGSGGVSATLTVPSVPSVPVFSPSGSSLLVSTAQSHGSDSMYVFTPGGSGWDDASLQTTLSAHVPADSGAGAFGNHVGFSGTTIASFGDEVNTRLFEAGASGWANETAFNAVLHALPVSLALSATNELVLGGGPNAAANFGPGLLILER
jgi:hypothetical protein